MLLSVIISITLALVFYTIGVWWEHKEGFLRKIHVVFFLLGLACDTTGTYLMSLIAKSSEAKAGDLMSAHGITGAIAIFLMLIHAIWAIIVLKRDNAESLLHFHEFSIFVWAVWLIPYILGMIMGLR